MMSKVEWFVENKAFPIGMLLWLIAFVTFVLVAMVRIIPPEFGGWVIAISGGLFIAEIVFVLVYEIVHG